MAAIPGSDRRTELETWLAPFLDRLRRKEQRRWAPAYPQGRGSARAGARASSR